MVQETVLFEFYKGERQKSGICNDVDGITFRNLLYSPI